MNFTTKCLLGATALIAAAAPASAKEWVDYSPGKGVWEVITVKVDPNKIDDYLLGLKKEWVPAEEAAKRHGIIDNYFVMVKANGSDGSGNVLLGQHYPSFSMLDPDKARDEAMDKEISAKISDKDAQAMVSGFDKYRSFTGDDLWQPVEFGK